MLYLRAKKDCYDHKSQITLIENELVTLNERAKMFPSIPDEYFEAIHISQRKIFMAFGCRFETK